MKKMKKLVGVLLALVMVLGMTTNVFADEVAPHTITAPDNGHTYEVYQIFTGDLSDGVLSNVKWGSNGTGATGEEVSSTILKRLEDVDADASYTEKLAVITEYADLTGTPVATLTKDALSADVAAGYYLIKDKNGSVTGEGDAYTTYIVQVLGDITFQPKSSAPSVEKTVKDVNDSAANDTVTWGESADYDIGDYVPFKLTATLADNVKEYSAYKVIFHDTLSPGLTYNGDAVVMFGEKDVTEYFSIKEENGKLTISCNNVKEFGATDNSIITVDYTAELNNKAEVGAVGNTNTVKLEYSNNPNAGYTGDTGNTPEDKVIVFTYQVSVDKIDENEDALEGAGFTLYKKDASGEYVAVGIEVKGEAMTTFTWAGLDDGDYKLVETTTPNGYNTIDPIEFTIAAQHGLTGITSLTGGDKFTAVTDTTNEAALTGALTADVQNLPGSILPSTGGMGTTLLYVLGGLMIVGAGTTLVMKRRRA